jgi:DNA-binding NtrC family response regulator
MLKILIVEDHPSLSGFLESYFTRRVTGYTVLIAPDKATALSLLQSEEPDLLLLDLRIPARAGGPPEARQGLDLARWVKRHWPTVQVVVLSAGAEYVPDLFRVVDNFFVKTFNDPAAAEVEWERLAASVARLIGHLASRSPAMQTFRAALLNVSERDPVVVLHGEEGVGKTYFARLLHQARWPATRLEERSCAAPDLAGFLDPLSASRKDLNGETVLLEGLENLPPPLQDHLARAAMGSRPTGSGRLRWILTATDSPAALRQVGRLNEALWRRLDPDVSGSTHVLFIPPLRERVADVKELTRLFRSQAAEDRGQPAPALHPDCFEVLQRYSWPGNVAQLRRVVEHAVEAAGGGEIQPAHLNVPLPTEYEALWRDAAGGPVQRREIAFWERSAFRSPDRFELVVEQRDGPGVKWEIVADGHPVDLSNEHAVNLLVLLLQKAAAGQTVTQADKPDLFGGDPQAAQTRRIAPYLHILRQALHDEVTPRSHSRVSRFFTSFGNEEYGLNETVRFALLRRVME